MLTRRGWQEEQLYLWQRRQKFATSLPGIKVLSDFCDPV